MASTPSPRPRGELPASASASLIGSIRVAGIDLEIFSPRTVHQPCAKMPLGSGRPADIRNAGQYTLWNRRMSLPIRWITDGK